jgi:hypothetical protein
LLMSAAKSVTALKAKSTKTLEQKA